MKQRTAAPAGLWFGLAFVGLGNLAGPAMGSVIDEPTCVYLRYEIETWVYAPVQVGEDLVGFLSWLPEEHAVGNNLKIVWQERQVNGGWSFAAWPDCGLHDAVAWLRARYNDDMLLAGDEDVAACIAPGVMGGEVVPAYLEFGLMVNDPMAPVVVSSEMPEDLLSLLAAIGWEAAPWVSELAVQTTGPCYGEGLNNALEGVLNGLLEDAEEELLGFSTVTHAGCAWPCKCKTIYDASSPSGPGTWTLDRSYVLQGRKHCEYSRPATRPFTRKGKWPILCGDCTGTGTETGREKGEEDVLPSENCPSGPSDYVFIPD